MGKRSWVKDLEPITHNLGPEVYRGCSSAGRAPALHAGGHRFESVHLHQGEGWWVAARDCGEVIDSWQLLATG